MGFKQEYLDHDTFENFEKDFEPEYVGLFDMPMMQPCHIDLSDTDRFLRFCDWKTQKHLRIILLISITMIINSFKRGVALIDISKD